IAYLLSRRGLDSMEFAVERLSKLSPEEEAKEEESLISDLEVFYQSAKRRFDEDAQFQKTARSLVVKLQAGEPQIRERWLDIVNETRAHYQPLYERLNVKLRREHE